MSTSLSSYVRLFALSSYSVRIESMLLKEEFPVVSDAMKRDIKILRAATKGTNIVLRQQDGCRRFRVVLVRVVVVYCLSPY